MAERHQALLRGFVPVSRPDARVLVLGSFPSEASLAAAEYYAFGRNAFWKLMAEITGVPADAPYEARCAGLLEQRIALWDVIAACRRRGSLDSAIEPASIVPNDFAGFFRTHPEVGRVCFNGAKAEDVFRRKALPVIEHVQLHLLRLPSTSPANASWSFERKRAVWTQALTG